MLVADRVLAHHQVMGKAYKARCNKSSLDQVTFAVLTKIGAIAAGSICNYKSSMLNTTLALVAKVTTAALP